MAEEESEQGGALHLRQVQQRQPPQCLGADEQAGRCERRPVVDSAARELAVGLRDRHGVDDRERRDEDTAPGAQRAESARDQGVGQSKALSIRGGRWAASKVVSGIQTIGKHINNDTNEQI